LFFNGNTFADVGRNVADFIFAEAPAPRRREIVSAVAHYIAGVLGWNEMVGIVHGVWFAAETFVPGVRVRTLRGSARGVVQRVLDDGRIAWLPDGGSMELLALPESLLPE
jgi:hypothetical protein